MRIALRKRYYCDFCKKVTGSRPVMERHEKGCTNNPNRVCSLCDYTAEGGSGKTLAELIAFLHAAPVVESVDLMRDVMDKDKATLAELRELSGDCPACMLAAIRQAKTDLLFHFDFKEEVARLWSEHREANPNPGHCYVY
jgi:hypothetical protein